MCAFPLKVRELSDEQLQELKNDLRYLIREGGWSFATLNQALGFSGPSGAVRNIVYDKSGRASTTRVRFDAVKRILQEKIEPGTILIQGSTTPRRPRKGKETAAVPAQAAPQGAPRGRRRKAQPDADGNGSAESAASSAPAMTFKMGGTEFAAQQQENGSWRVVLTATCSTEQMAAWSNQIMSDQLNLQTPASTE